MYFSVQNYQIDLDFVCCRSYTVFLWFNNLSVFDVLAGFLDEVSCDFSGGNSCGWASASGDPQWVIISSSSGDTHHVGPLGDHTNGTPTLSG